MKSHQDASSLGIARAEQGLPSRVGQFGWRYPLLALHRESCTRTCGFALAVGNPIEGYARF